MACEKTSVVLNLYLMEKKVNDGLDILFSFKNDLRDFVAVNSKVIKLRSVLLKREEIALSRF